MLDVANPPEDIAALKAMLVAGQEREAGQDAQMARKNERIERLEKLVAAFKQAAFGRKSEKTDPDQFDLALEDLVEHFRRHVARLLEGQAKAMIVTSSRDHAMRYYFGVRDYIVEQGYSDLRALVAFSGELPFNNESIRKQT